MNFAIIYDNSFLSHMMCWTLESCMLDSWLISKLDSWSSAADFSYL